MFETADRRKRALLAGMTILCAFSVATPAAGQVLIPIGGRTCQRSGGGNGGNCNNTQQGDNRGGVRQSGEAETGDAVGGSVVGVAASGDTTIDASNRSSHVDARSGDADASNDALAQIGNGLSIETFFFGTCRRSGGGNGSNCVNLQIGDNIGSLDQLADAVSGDGVAGMVIGATTSAGGRTTAVLANESTFVRSRSGDAEALNDEGDLFVGRNIVIRGL
jgi:hypothetical protein